MTTGERLKLGLDRGEVLWGVMVGLPAGDVVDRAERAGFDVVVIDLLGGPIDEVALWRLVHSAHRGGLGVVALTDRSIDAGRVHASGVDGVVVGRGGSAQFGDGRECSFTVARDAADARRRSAVGPALVALDLDSALDGLLSAFLSDAVRASGASPSLVLLAGMLGDARVFDCVVAALPAHVSCRPARIDLDDSIAEMAESVLAASPPRFALAGHSLGGIVALEICRLAPERVTRLALLNTSARPASADQLTAWAGLRDRTEAGEFAALAAEQAAVNVGPAGEQDLVARWTDMAARVGPDGFCRQLKAQAVRPDARPTLPSIAVPTLVISGGQDRVCPPELQREIAAAVPGARHVTIDGAGHMSPLDHPAEVATYFTEWLND